MFSGQKLKPLIGKNDCCSDRPKVLVYLLPGVQIHKDQQPISLHQVAKSAERLIAAILLSEELPKGSNEQDEAYQKRLPVKMTMDPGGVPGRHSKTQ